MFTGHRGWNRAAEAGQVLRAEVAGGRCRPLQGLGFVPRSEMKPVEGDEQRRGVICRVPCKRTPGRHAGDQLQGGRAEAECRPEARTHTPDERGCCLRSGVIATGKGGGWIPEVCRG